jgi:hypothetical protein
VPAHIGCGPDAFAPFNEIEVDHRLPAVGLAFFASLETGAAADAARRVNVELVTEHYAPPRDS